MREIETSGEGTPLKAPSSVAALAIWTDVTPEAEHEFNTWYRREHIPDRVAIPGFRRGSRYRAISAEPRYFAFYDVDAIEALVAPAYRQRLNAPTLQTERIMPSFRNTTRALCRVRSSVGRGAGNIVLTLRFTSRIDIPDNDLTVARLLQSLYDSPSFSIVRAQHWKAERDAAPPSRESLLRGNADLAIDSAIVVEGENFDGIVAAEHELLAEGSPLCDAARRPVISGKYELLFVLNAGD